MRATFIFIFTVSYFVCFGQNPTTEIFKRDSLLIVSKNSKKRFYHDYVLFIPKETRLNKKTFLLVETNNTGKTSDTIEVHKRCAIDLASVSSVGKNVATELHIPLLITIFPRPASQELI